MSEVPLSGTKSNGGRRGIRTPDRWLKRPLLYQLSYAPEYPCTLLKNGTALPGQAGAFGTTPCPSRHSRTEAVQFVRGLDPTELCAQNL